MTNRRRRRRLRRQNLLQCGRKHEGCARAAPRARRRAALLRHPAELPAPPAAAERVAGGRARRRRRRARGGARRRLLALGCASRDARQVRRARGRAIRARRVARVRACRCQGLRWAQLPVRAGAPPADAARRAPACARHATLHGAACSGACRGARGARLTRRRCTAGTRFSSVHSERVSQVVREQAEEDKPVAAAASPGGRALSETTLSHLGLTAPAWHMETPRQLATGKAGRAAARRAALVAGPSEVIVHSNELEPYDGPAPSAPRSPTSVLQWDALKCSHFLSEPGQLKSVAGDWIDAASEPCINAGCKWIAASMSHRGKCQLAESSDPSHPDPTPIPDTVGSCIVSSWLVAILGVDAGACGGPHTHTHTRMRARAHTHFEQDAGCTSGNQHNSLGQAHTQHIYNTDTNTCAGTRTDTDTGRPPHCLRSREAALLRCAGLGFQEHPRLYGSRSRSC